MGLLLPFILLKTSSNNTLQLFNKINNTILELENKNKADKDKYENDIAVLNEKNKNLEENLEKERITNQELKNNNNNLELLKEENEREIEKEREINNNKEKEIKNLHNNIEELNKKINKSEGIYKTNLEKLKNKNKEKDNTIKSLTQKIDGNTKIIEQNENQIKELSQSIETYKNHKSDYENRINKIIEENNKKQSNIIEQNNSLKNKIKEQNSILKNKDDLIKSYESKINELNKKKNEFTEENKNAIDKSKEIELISEKYKEESKERLNKTLKSLVKQIGDKLSTMRKKYEGLYKQKENLMSEKFEELKKLINNANTKLENINNINFNNVQNLEIKNSDNTINLDDDVDLLSRTQVITKNKLINLDKFEGNNIINNFKDNNINKNKNNEMNKINKELNPNMTPHGPKNFVLRTPGGGENPNNITPGENLDYSFDCTNAMYLTSYIYEGTSEVKLNIILNNNGTKPWPNNTILKIIEPSDFELDDIILKSQRPGEERTYYLKFKNLENLQPGIYQTNLAFCCNGEICGEKLVARLKINKLNDSNREIEENLDKINEFRQTFDLNKDEYPDEKILEILKENDFNFESAFSSIFG